MNPEARATRVRERAKALYDAWLVGAMAVAFVDTIPERRKSEMREHFLRVAESQEE